MKWDFSSSDNRNVDLITYVHSFYIMLALKMKYEKQNLPFPNLRYFKHFCKSFAKTLYDYLVLVCLGEAVCANEKGEFVIREFIKYNTDEIATAKNRVYQFHNFIDPVSSASSLLEVFEGKWKDHSYGGEKWASIVNAYLKYHKLSNILFIDYVINKQHNSSSVFNKSIFFEPLNAKKLMVFLNIRRERDILSINNIPRLSLTQQVVEMIELAKESEICNTKFEYDIRRDTVLPKPLKWGFYKLNSISRSDDSSLVNIDDVDDYENNKKFNYKKSDYQEYVNIHNGFNSFFIDTMDIEPRGFENNKYIEKNQNSYKKIEGRL